MPGSLVDATASDAVLDDKPTEKTTMDGPVARELCPGQATPVYGPRNRHVISKRQNTPFVHAASRTSTFRRLPRAKNAASI